MNTRIFLLSLFLYSSLFSQESLRTLSWNIQNFGQHKTPSQIEQIASIITEYDLVAIQGIEAQEQSAEKAMSQLVKALHKKGFDWSYTLSQPTKAKKNSRERYAFLWKTNRVNVLGKGSLIKSLQRKVLQEPFVLKIRWNTEIVTLYNYHAKSYKTHPEKEITILATYLSQTKEPYLVLGSFNLIANHKVFNNFKTNNLYPVVNKEKTLLYSYCRYRDYLHLSTDNMYYSRQNLQLISSGVLDYVSSCENLKMAFRISRHLPVVAHFSLQNTATQGVLPLVMQNTR